MSQGLSVEDVSRRYGRRWALARVTLEIPPGDSWMLLGPNGSGKSTLIKCLSTRLKVHHGTIRLGGEDLWMHRSRLRRQIAVLSHDSALYDDLSSRENLDVWARLGAFSPDPVSLLERVGLEPDRPDPVRTYSAGMRKRLALARVLLKQPSILLLDEPFTALDPAGRDLLVSVIRELQEGGTTLIMATHLPRVAQQVCANALVLESGQPIYQGPSSDVPADRLGMQEANPS
ncbi:MAG: heme ABC exporter ATP-binding protein CcmA [Myxococcota bacterium]